ncbi:aldose epimerase family protein [Saccharicrinis aurantiacus]|uniref:aldose epimerase family protein n=1 Tax=Saccharicrinis aurantiacus TaxID=1849719 RepID=UPI00094F6CEF|nr:aldose epimerase family protein [Saccharicrinis aurantiacus]
MQSTKQQFGKYNNQDVSLFVLENDNGMIVKIMDLGATITQITIPGKGIEPVSIACGFNSVDGYLSDAYKNNSPYFGCTVGRYCSQIKDAKFSLNEEEYKLNANCGDNNLHGGTVGFDKQFWAAEEVATKDKVGVQFKLKSPHFSEGFPGNVEAEVTIFLSNDNEIIINYAATTDQTTPLSMTNHTYWNLSGFEKTVESSMVQVNTNKLLALDETGAVTGEVKDVSNTIEDLREAKVVSDVHSALGDGFEHFYVFDKYGVDLNKAAEVTEPSPERKLEVYTTEPCMLFYTGKYTSDELKRDENEKYGKYRGFACETHRWPNGPNLENAPQSFTSPDEVFKSTTVFKLTF